MRRNSMLSILVGGLLATAAGGCTDAGRPLFILQNQIPDTSCEVNSSANSSFRSSGIIDVNAPGGYVFFPLVQNVAEAPNTADDSAKVVLIRGADVELSFQSGFLDGVSGDPISVIDANRQLTRPFSGNVQPNGGLQAFAFEILSRNLVNALADPAFDGKFANGTTTIIEANITVFGEMDGGGVESEEFTYPVEVGKGILKNNLGDCATLPAGINIREGFPCDANALQDVIVDCCTSGGVDVCPAQPVAAANP